MQQTLRKPPLSSGQDATALLTADHHEVKKMFLEFARLVKTKGTDDAKNELVQMICEALTVHAKVEEEIFYPAVRAAIDDDELMDEADVEHASAKGLITQLESMTVGDDHFDAKVTVLGELIDHHVKEEQDEMFPKARKSQVDLAALGARIVARKKELQHA